jgi:N-acetyl-anhydromuramyl-L-alanine amidase AmpD
MEESKMDILKITNRPSPNMSKGRQGHIPDLIVCHITDGAFPGSINWVTNPFSEVSYHYMISRTGEITQCVDLEDMAWANGTDNNGGSRDNRHSRLEIVRSRRVNANLYTVSIGFEGRHSETQGALTPEQFAAGVNVIELIIGEIYDIWGAEISLSQNSIVGHKCITPSHRPSCPGDKFPLIRIIKALEKQLYTLKNSNMQNKEQLYTLKDSSTQNKQQFKSGHMPDNWALESWAWAMNELNMDGTRPRDNITRQEAITLMHRLHNLTAHPAKAGTGQTGCECKHSLPAHASGVIP